MINGTGIIYGSLYIPFSLRSPLPCVEWFNPEVGNFILKTLEFKDIGVKGLLPILKLLLSAMLKSMDISVCV